MRYFDVKREELRGSLMSGVVYSDGEYIEEADEVEMRTLTTGFNVWEYDENGMTERVVFYPVKTDMESWTDDSDIVLEHIKSIYTPDKWQNNNW